MISGNPRLAVWTAGDNTLRIFELATDESSFQQVGVATMTHSGSSPNKPFLAFNSEGTRVMGFHITNFSSFAGSISSMYALDGVNIQDANVPTINDGIFKAALTPESDLWIVINNFNSIPNSMKASEVSWQNQQNIAANGSFTAIAASEKNLFLGLGATQSLMFHADSVNPTFGTPIFTASDVLGDMQISPDAAAFVPNGLWLIAAENNTIEIWSVVDETYDLISDIVETGVGNANAIACRYDSKWVAISFNNAEVYTTYVYERVGGYLKKRQTINTFGKTLQWTADGRYLLDSGQKKAQLRAEDGSFSNVDAKMANLPANVVVDAISDHVAQPVPFANLYSAAIQAFSLQTLDVDGCKLALLDNTYVFDASAGSAAVILAAAEVAENNWPVGGVQITGLAFVAGPGDLASVTFDPIEQIVTQGGLTYQSILVYDETNDTPLVYATFGEDVVVPSNVTVTIESADGTLLKFVT